MLDRPADSTVDVSFNITMERLPCRFASVDLFDETGTKRLNITLSIRKTRLSALDGSHLPDAARIAIRGAVECRDADGCELPARRCAHRATRREKGRGARHPGSQVRAVRVGVGAEPTILRP